MRQEAEEKAKAEKELQNPLKKEFRRKMADGRRTGAGKVGEAVSKGTREAPAVRALCSLPASARVEIGASKVGPGGPTLTDCCELVPSKNMADHSQQILS